MEIFANGKKRAEWRRSDDRNVQLKEQRLPLGGRVLSRAEAERRLSEKARRGVLIVSVAAGVSLTGGLIAFAARGASAGDHILLLAVCVAFFFALNFWPETGRHDRVRQRYERGLMTEADAEIRLDAEKVVYAGEVIAWSELEAVRLEVMPLPGDTDEIAVDAVTARAGGRLIAFDRYAMENGAALVEAAYDRLIRQRGLAV